MNITDMNILNLIYVFFNLNIVFSDTIRFLDNDLIVLRHVAGENAVLSVKYDTPPDHCLPLEFTW